MALEEKGLDCEVIGIDTDASACRTFQKNKVGQAIRADARYPPLRLEQRLFDIVVGCPPCQGFARLRGSPDPDDPRNSLILVFLNWIEKLLPKQVFFENVSWIRKSHYCDKLITNIERLGYETAFDTVNAADFGIPQRRKRFLLIACMKGRPNLPEPTHIDPNFAEKTKLEPWVTVGQVIRDLPSLRQGLEDPSVPNHYAMKHSALVQKRIRSVPKDGGSRSSFPTELQLKCHQESQGFNDVYGRMSWDSPSPTITCGCCNPSKGRFLHPEQDRAISPREAARLQTFPDWFVFYGSKTSIQSQIGNALPVLLSRKAAIRNISTLMSAMV